MSLWHCLVTCQARFAACQAAAWVRTGRLEAQTIRWGLQREEDGETDELIYADLSGYKEAITEYLQDTIFTKQKMHQEGVTYLDGEQK